MLRASPRTRHRRPPSAPRWITTSCSLTVAATTSLGPGGCGVATGGSTGAAKGGGGVGSSFAASLGASAGRGVVDAGAGEDPLAGAGTTWSGRWPLPSHTALRSSVPMRSSAISGFSTRKLLASWPWGKSTRYASMPAPTSRLASCTAALSPAGSRSYAISTRSTPWWRKASRWSSVNPSTPYAAVTLRCPATHRLRASISASQRMTSGQAPSAASFQTPRCGPGRYRCSGVPARNPSVILRPYTSATLPSGSITGITSEPLKCSWPDSRRTPSRCSRVRISSPARRVFSGSRSPRVRLAKPS